MLIMKLNVAMVLGQLLLTINQVTARVGRPSPGHWLEGGQAAWRGSRLVPAVRPLMAGPAPAFCKLILTSLRAEVEVFSYRPSLFEPNVNWDTVCGNGLFEPRTCLE